MIPRSVLASGVHSTSLASSAATGLGSLYPACAPMKLKSASKLIGLNMGPRGGSAVWGC